MLAYLVPGLLELLVLDALAGELRGVQEVRGVHVVAVVLAVGDRPPLVLGDVRADRRHARRGDTEKGARDETHKAEGLRHGKTETHPVYKRIKHNQNAIEECT